MKKAQIILLHWRIRSNHRAAAYSYRLWLRLQRRMLQRSLRLYGRLYHLEGQTTAAGPQKAG